MPRDAAPGRPALGPLVLVGAVAVLVVTAVLARGGTATDEAAVDRTRASLAATPSVPAEPSAPDPVSPLPGGAVVVRTDGVDGLRLGMGTAEVVAAGYSVQAEAVPDPAGSGAPCRRVLPGLDDPGPGPGVAGWLVGERVGAVTLDDRSGPSSSFLGPGVGARLDDLPVDGLLRGSRPVPVPWQDAPVVVDVAWVRTSPQVRVAFADLGEDGTVDHVQVLQAAAAHCAGAASRARAAREAGLPVLDLQGWGQLRIGTPLAVAAGLVDVVDEGDRVVGAASDGGPSCRLAMGEDEPGLLYLVVGDEGTGEPVVRGITVDAGVTDAGLVVGDPAEKVAGAYPGITTAYLDGRWGQGLSADWQVDGGVLRLWPGREEVAVDDVDAVLRGPRDVVGLIQVGPGC